MAVLRLLYLCCVGGIILSVILLFARSPHAQNVDPPPAISLDFRCPTYSVSGAQPLKLFADILGTEDPEIIRPFVFRWTISGGKIQSGQGTTEITVTGPDSNRNELGVNLVVEGGPPELGNEKSCVVKVNPACLLAPKIDEYGAIPIDEESRHSTERRLWPTTCANPQKGAGSCPRPLWLTPHQL